MFYNFCVLMTPTKTYLLTIGSYFALKAKNRLFKPKLNALMDKKKMSFVFFILVKKTVVFWTLLY